MDLQSKYVLLFQQFARNAFNNNVYPGLPIALVDFFSDLAKGHDLGCVPWCFNVHKYTRIRWYGDLESSYLFGVFKLINEDVALL